MRATPQTHPMTTPAISPPLRDVPLPFLEDDLSLPLSFSGPEPAEDDGAGESEED